MVSLLFFVVNIATTTVDIAFAVDVDVAFAVDVDVDDVVVVAVDGTVVVAPVAKAMQ